MINYMQITNHTPRIKKMSIFTTPSRVPFGEANETEGLGLPSYIISAGMSITPEEKKNKKKIKDIDIDEYDTEPNYEISNNTVRKRILDLNSKKPKLESKEKKPKLESKSKKPKLESKSISISTEENETLDKRCEDWKRFQNKKHKKMKF